jgi:hypothetical protein
VAVTSWHYGKVILLWAWGALLSILALYVALGLEPDGQDTALSILGLIAIAVAFLIPACLSVVTWIWLGGKERAGSNEP